MEILFAYLASVVISFFILLFVTRIHQDIMLYEAIEMGVLSFMPVVNVLLAIGIIIFHFTTLFNSSWRKIVYKQFTKGD